MIDTEAKHDSGAIEAPMLGDHLAMDLLNTELRNNGVIVESWNTGDDVLKWLDRCGVDTASTDQALDPVELQAKAIGLRRLARELIVQRKQNEVGDISRLNEYLHAYLSAPHLERDSQGNLTLSRSARGQAIASLLGPLAEAVAQLLAEGNFSLVKQCEHPDCILWFYDRTKAHRRRWCSMALCGNRYKAAQFRKRSSSKTA